MIFSRCRSLAAAVCIVLVCVVQGSSNTAAPNSDIERPIPATTEWGTRGLSQTASAEALGYGRLNFSLMGTWYRQHGAFPGAPNPDADIATGIGVMAFGISDYFDIFGGTHFFTSSNYIAETTSGLGTGIAGIQASLPLPRTSPLRLGFQGAVLAGQSKNQIDSNYTDGYDYFETRTGYDFMGKLLESVVLGSENRGFKIHLNQGVVKSLEKGKDYSLLLALGLQADLTRVLSINVEVNSRTDLKNTSFKADPLCVTPSVVIRTPARLSLTFGGDISASGERLGDAAANSLEQYRLFGSVLLSFDCLEGARRAAVQKAERDSLEHMQCRRDAEKLNAATVSLVASQKRVVDDSLTAMRIKKTNDSLLAAGAALLRKSQQDSVALVAALAEARRLLEFEKARRSDMEKKLLSTGMLILDAVYFESAKTEISMNSKPYLRIIGKMLEKYPKLALEVGGHTDNTGNPEKNRTLSQHRSDAVRDFLIQVAPELSGRLTAMGYGSSVPKLDNKTASGRKANRRVEIRVTNPDALKDYN